ncbi:MAG: KH domain-containing protein, partial [Dehalococcoidia bacterium]
GIDPVGSCVGLRGIRIQNIVNELHGEKIDVVQWDKDPAIFIANSLSPAQVAKVEIDETEKAATVVVSDRHLSLAIGKEGQNARLAAKLTGWRIDIKGASEAEEEKAATATLTQEEPLAAEPATKPPPEEVAPVKAVAKEPAPPEPKVEDVAATKEPVPVAEVAPQEIHTDEVTPEEEQVVLEEPAPVLEEEPVAPAVEEVDTTKSIEEIFPTIPEVVVKTVTELRFAEDLDIHIPGRSAGRGKKRKGKKGGGRRVGRSAKGKKSRSTATPT